MKRRAAIASPPLVEHSSVIRWRRSDNSQWIISIEGLDGLWSSKPGGRADKEVLVLRLTLSKEPKDCQLSVSSGQSGGDG